MGTDLDRLEQRLTRLERELRAWRGLGSALALSAIGLSCGTPPDTFEQRNALDLVSEDGSRRVHLGPEGLRIEVGDRSASYSEELVTLQHGSLGVTLAPDGLSMEGEGGALAAVSVSSIWVSGGTGRAAISVEGASTGIVRASGEGASATISATSAESTMSLRGVGEPSVTGVVAAAASVTVAGTGGVVHVYGAE